MCLILVVVFASLSISFALDGMVQNAIINGVIAFGFFLLLGWRIYTNKECLFKRGTKKCD